MARYIAALCELENSTSQKLLNDVIVKLRTIQSSEVRICLFASNSHLRTQCMVCTYIRRYERMHLILDSCWPAQVGLPECWVVLGEWGPFSREHAPKEFGDLEPLWSVQALRKEEYTHQSYFYMQPALRNSTIQCYLVWVTTAKREHLFWKTFFRHRLMFQWVSWPVIRDHLFPNH